MNKKVQLHDLKIISVDGSPAVTIKHIPTGEKVTVCESMHQCNNRAKALKMIKYKVENN